jgi:H+/Cl- antiporter ClcA
VVGGLQATGSIAPLAQFRTILVSFLAAGIGLVDGIVAFALYKLIGFFTNAFFFHRISADFTSARFHHLGAPVIVIPVMGGIIVAFMAKYGTPRIKGHGTPEAMEAVLINRSRIEPRAAILKPISAAVAIGTGGPFGAEGPIIQTGGALGLLVGQLFHTTASERKVLLGLWSRRWYVGHLQHPNCASSCYRTAVIRVQIPVFHSSGHCQHARNRCPHAVAGHRSNV